MERQALIKPLAYEQESPNYISAIIVIILFLLVPAYLIGLALCHPLQIKLSPILQSLVAVGIGYLTIFCLASILSIIYFLYFCFKFEKVNRSAEEETY